MKNYSSRKQEHLETIPESELEKLTFNEMRTKYESQKRTSEANLDIKERLKSILGTLSYREREIIKLRYGIPTSYNYTLEEVGKIFNVTRERVRQIEAKAIKKLAHPMRARKLIGFIENCKK